MEVELRLWCKPRASHEDVTFDYSQCSPRSVVLYRMIPENDLREFLHARHLCMDLVEEAGVRGLFVATLKINTVFSISSKDGLVAVLIPHVGESGVLWAGPSDENYAAHGCWYITDTIPWSRISAAMI